MRTRISRDLNIDQVLREVRISHRAYLRGTVAKEANRSARRGRAMLRAQQAVEPHADVLEANADARPTVRDWRAARGDLRALATSDDQLAWDLNHAIYDSSDTVSEQEVIDAIVDAAIAYQGVIDLTRTHASAGSSAAPQPKLPRKRKQQLRTRARKDFYAVLAGISLAITHSHNHHRSSHPSRALGVVQAGALRRG